MKLRWKIAQWFELWWWKNYLNDRNKDEYLSWKKDYWKNAFSKIPDEIKIDSSTAIVDLGCGPTGIFIALPKNQLTAIDPLIDEYEKQTPFFKKSDYPNTTFVRNTIENFESNEKFDLVFCMNAINHLYDIEKGFDKLKEICSAGGILILSIDAHNFSLFKYLFRLIPSDILHPHQHDLEEYKLFLEKRGMKILKTELLKTEFLFRHWLIVAQR